MDVFKSTIEDGPIDKLAVRSSTLLVTTLSSDLSELTRDALLKPYHDREGLSRWVSSTRALVVFPSSSAARNALRHKNMSISVSLLSEIGERIATELDECE